MKLPRDIVLVSVGAFQLQSCNPAPLVTCLYLWTSGFTCLCLSFPIYKAQKLELIICHPKNGSR